MVDPIGAAVKRAGRPRDLNQPGQAVGGLVYGSDGPSADPGPDPILCPVRPPPPRWPDTEAGPRAGSAPPAAPVSRDGAVIPRRLSPGRGITAPLVP